MRGGEIMRRGRWKNGTLRKGEKTRDYR